MQNKTTHVINGSVLLGSVVVSNFLNFLFNALLGRWLSFESFGLITLVVTFYYLSTIFTGSLASSINFYVSKHPASAASLPFLHRTIKKTLSISAIFSVVWLLCTPLLMNFFHLSSPAPLISVVVTVLFSAFAYAVNGYFQGELQFAKAGLLSLIEPVMKLIGGVALALTGMGMITYLSIPFSLIVTGIFAVILLQRSYIKLLAPTDKSKAVFPSHFFFTTVIASIGSAAFYSIDIILVRHFFSPELSGQYALVSLIGKMMYFFCVLPNMFTLPIVARAKTKATFNKLFLILVGATSSLVLFGWFTLGVFGRLIIPMLFGNKVLPILSLLPPYLIGVGVFAISSVIISFHQAKQEYVFSYSLIVASLLLFGLILLRHATLSEVAGNIAITSIALVLFLGIAHPIFERRNAAYAIT